MKLKQYQEEGINFLLDNGTIIPKHSILGDDMGLGKTAQAICAASKVGAKKILVICPSAVKINWMREFIQWSNYRNIFIVGKKGNTPAKNCVIDKDAEVIILNYDLCIMPKIKKQLCSMKFDVGIIDECHYLMNKTSGRTKAILARGGIIWSCEYKWALSGTIMKNRNRDCYAILRSLFPHILGGYSDYRTYAEYFCGGHMGAFGYEDSSSTHTGELGKMMSAIMIRRTKADVLSQLPELIEQNIYLEETPEIVSVLRSQSEFTEEDVKAILNFEMLGQTASFRKELAMAKAKQCVDYIKGILENVDKVTVFAYHRDLINLLEEKLSDYGVQVVMGGLTPEQKQERVDNFVNDPNERVFIGQIQAAGTGVDGLQLVCSDVVFAEIDWVPGTIDQARARCHRMGQKNTTHIHYLVVGDSLEESMLNVLRNKRNNIKTVMKQVEREVKPNEEQKGEEVMTLESTLERIAIALEKIAEKENGVTRIELDPPLVVPVQKETPVVEEKKPAKKKTKKEITQEESKEEPTLVEAVATEIVEEVKKEVVKEPEIKRDLEAVLNDCKLKATELMQQVGREVATLYINEVTAQITGIEGARLKDCNLAQAEAVLDAIVAKLSVPSNLEGVV